MENQNELLFPHLTSAQIACLKAFGEEIELPEGATVFREGEEEQAFFLVLEGELRITRDVAGGEVVLAVHKAGEFTGALGLLAGEKAIATGVVIVPARLQRLDRHAFIQMLAACPEVGEMILGAMARRRPEADALVQQRERLAALGKLSAGLAHELNNPAAAALRASSELRVALERLHECMAELVCALPTQQWRGLQEKMQVLSPEARRRPPRSPLQCADAEEAMGEWLDAQGVRDAWQVAPVLSDAGLERADLEQITALVLPENLDITMRWVAVRLETDALLEAVTQSVGRISDLVAAVKSYSYMDQAPRQEVNITQGIENTLTMLNFKRRKKNIEVIRQYEPDLPPIAAYGSELNQVWTNLLDNAIDALPESGGVITIQVRREDEMLCVQIKDNGSGIPPDVLKRIFEPFFTTKPPGQGTGLGLDVVHRIVTVRHHGNVRVTSQPGETIFEVRIPV